MKGITALRRSTARLACCMIIVAIVVGCQSNTSNPSTIATSRTTAVDQTITLVPITPKPFQDPSIIRISNADRVKLLMTLDSYSGASYRVVFSPDSGLLASANADNTIKLWDVKTWREFNTLAGHTDTVTSIAFSPDGTTLVSGSTDRTIRLWDIKTGKEIRKIGELADAVLDVALSPNGKTVATASRVSLTNFLECAPKGSCPDGEIRIYDLSSYQEMFRLVAHKQGVTALAFSPDGNQLVSGGQSDWSVKIWDAKTGRETSTLTNKDTSGSTVGSIAFSPDGNQFAAIIGTVDVKMWNSQSRTEIPNNINRPNPQDRNFFTNGFLSRIAFSPDGTMLAVSSGQFPNSVTFSLWEVATSRLLMKSFGDNNHKRDYGVSFSPDGRFIASGSDDGKIRIWGIQ